MKNIAYVIFPPRCYICDALSGSHGGALCPLCWQDIEYLLDPMCACCGVPVPADAADITHIVCAGCVASPPAYSKARAAFVYNDMSSALISRLKFYDSLHLLPFLARQTARAGQELLQDCDIIIPVPLHRTRLRKRMYNQAALLAKYIGRHSDTSVRYDLLKRIRATEQQTGKSRKARLRNLASAFAVPTHKKSAIYGKNIALIDDVLTTGATAARCTKVLKDAGASSVSVLTICRTPLR